MNIWKQFLEQNDDYNLDLDTLYKDSVVSAQPYVDQIKTLDIAISDEVKRFGVLLDEKSKTTKAIEALEEDKSSKKPKKKKKGKKN